MPIPTTVIVLLISSSGLRFTEVPACRPASFRLYEPWLRTEDGPEPRAVRTFQKADDFTYVEQES